MSRVIAEFIAALPQVKSAVLLDGGPDLAAQVKLEIPGIYRVEALKLAALAGRTFRVVVHEDDGHVHRPTPDTCKPLDS